MATFTIDIPPAAFPAVQAALLKKWNYQEYIGTNEVGDLIPNPECQNDFLRRKIKETMKGWYRKQVVIDGGEDANSTTPDSGIEVT